MDSGGSTQKDSHCKFYVERKNRFCKFGVVKGQEYCSEHLPRTESGEVMRHLYDGIVIST